MNAIYEGSEPPSSDELRSVIVDLLALHAATPSITVGVAKIQRLMLLHGLVEHTLATAKAALILWDSGDGAGFPSLARVAFEHALVAQWVHTHPDGLDGFMTHADNRQRTFLNNLPEASNAAAQVKKALDALGDPVSAPGPVRHFEQTCRAFDPSGWLYLMYRVLSDYVHPGPGTFHRYVADNDDPAQPAVLRLAPYDPNPQAALLVLTMSVVLVSGVYEDLRRGKPNKAAVRRIAGRVGMRPLLGLSVSPP